MAPALKVYADRMSQPTRAVLLFCKASGVEFEEVTISLFKKKQLSKSYLEVNPIKQVPAIAHGDFKLGESHAILIYIASAFPGVADHWYPADLKKRAKLQSVLDWHHGNLRRGAVGYILQTVLAPVIKIPHDPIAIADYEKTLTASLTTIETVYLKGDGKFLLGSKQPSIADLSLVCEIMQLKMLEDAEYARLVAPYKKVERWVEDVKKATNPHFDELHKTMFKTCEMIKGPFSMKKLFSIIKG